MKVLWMSDSPTSPSGFGNVTRFICAGLADYGHQVSILGWQARGTPEPWRNCMLYPVRHNGLGADVLLNYLRRLQPDILVTLADVWWLTFISNPMIAGFMRMACIPWALYFPIDGDMGDGQLPVSWTHILKTVDLPIAMSRYGVEVSQANGIHPSYIPHGVETNVFRPPVDKTAAKRALGYEGKFVILSDARNQPRKQLPRLLEIFRRFSADKDDVVLHLHCDPNDPAAMTPEYCYDLKADIAFLGLGDKAQVTDGMSIATGLTLSQLAAIYQAADVHLLASLGEGFGLPTLQAASAGVVPMASDYTASRELTENHGEPIAIRHFLSDQFGLRRALIDIDDAVTRLENLYNDRQLLAAKSEASRQFAEKYDWSEIVPQWNDLLHREAPRLRQNLRYPASSQITLGASANSANSSNFLPAELAAAVRSAMPAPRTAGRGNWFGATDEMAGARITVNVTESKLGQLSAEVLLDAQAYERTLTIPVTLPPDEASPVKMRVTGCVYAASERDVPVIRELSLIFPGLNVWSLADLELGSDRVSGEMVQVKATPPDSEEYRRRLAASTLAIDLGGIDPDLPLQAAQFGVPCIGLTAQTAQMRFWPELSLANPDAEMAAELGRRLLTDQGAVEEFCALARNRLANSSAITETGR
ncbi:MAG: glycosyltransferase family 4 protein [Acidobacteria bacterium]|nr:glycosyltransferase family 4 protein [Acidobacteriota bacterium]